MFHSANFLVGLVVLIQTKSWSWRLLIEAEKISTPIDDMYDEYSKLLYLDAPLLQVDAPKFGI